MNSSSSAFFENNPVSDMLGRKPLRDDGHFDITAMIDLVFMMNIFFLVTTVTAALSEIDLPAAKHVSAVEADEAVFVTIVPDFEADSVTVNIGDATTGQAISEPAAQEQAIREAVETGVADGKTMVVLKAEKKVRLREMARLSSAASAEGVQLNLAVLEKE
jgi:biopolymer transport protein ExbD